MVSQRKAPPRVHATARAFDKVPAEYERGRPEYPADAIEHLVHGLGFGPGRELLELGSGTGKLTRALLPFGGRIVAVEPSPGMRAFFAVALPKVPLLDGTAEAIPAEDGAFDAVVAGQAFHWFRPGPAAREIARVLRPGGRLGLVWNRRDERVRWVAGFGRIMDTYRGSTPNPERRPWRAGIERSGRFAPLERRDFYHEHRLSVARVVDRAVSVSFIALEPPRVREKVARDVRALLASDPATKGRRSVGFPYRTEVYLTQRLADA